MALFAVIAPFNDWSFKGDPTLISQYGTFASGVAGPLFALAAFLILFQTLLDQQRASKVQQFEAGLFQLLSHYNATVENLSTRSTTSLRGHRIRGRDVFIEMKKQMDEILDVVRAYHYDSPESFVINIAYLCFYYGVGQRTLDVLAAVLAEQLKKDQVHFLIQELRERKTDYDDDVVKFGGHQSRLGHYFRQLFTIIRYIDESELFKLEQKYSYARLVRSMLSNYEEAILFFDAMSKLGAEWIRRGWITEYRLIKNLPRHFLSPIDPKRYFPEIPFEYEEASSQK